MNRVLTDQPDIRQLRRQAKELLRDVRAADGAALQRLAEQTTSGEGFTLASAQRVLALEYGYGSWPRLRRAAAESIGSPDDLRPSRTLVADKFRTQEVTYTARAFVDSARRAGWDPGLLPQAIVFAFHPVYARLLADDPRFEQNKQLAPGNATMFTSFDGGVGVTCLSAGAKAMIAQVENQVALGGASRFILLGTAGSLQPDITVGDVVVVSSAVRDEGISNHYLPPDTYVDADAQLVAALHSHLLDARLQAMVGSTWTVPTPYRSTLEEVALFASDGVAVVECEVASLLAVAEALGSAATACLTVTSSMLDKQPDSALRPPEPKLVLDAVLRTVGLSDPGSG